jgi:hypothetical protein
MIAMFIDASIRAKAIDNTAVKQEECPPHQWMEARLENEDGDVLLWALKCKKCGFRGGE